MVRSLGGLDLLAIVIYFAGVAAIGLRAGRRSRSTEAYFLGGRSLPGWAVGLSLVGTSISSISFLALPADAFKTAWLRLAPNLVLPLGVLAASWFFLGFYRTGRTTTAFEYLEARFGPSTRVYGALAFVVGQVLRVSLILFLVGQLLHELTGLSPEASVLIAGAFVCLYTVAGGLEAVVWTDVAQTLVLSVGGLSCLAVVAVSVPGGLSEVFASAWAAGKLGFSELMPDGTLRPAGLSLSLTDKTLSMMFVVGLSHWLAEYGCNQNVVQRYCASASTREARRALWVGCWTAIPLWTGFMFLGSALWVFYQHFPTEVSTGILAGELRAERIVPHFVLQELPAGLTGLVVAGVLAAAMSSLDSSLNAMSTVGVVDVYRRHLVKGSDDGHYLRVARVGSMLGSVAMVSGALLLLQSETKTLQDAATTLIALTSGGLLGLYLLGFLTKRGDGRSVAIAIALTLAFSLYRASAQAAWFPDGLRLSWLDAVDGYYTAILAHVLMFGVGYAASLVLPRRRPVDPALTARTGS
jgi:SSS family solute:Na+ symporter